MQSEHDRVDVHHLRYGRLYDVTTDDLIPLCRSCHDIVHGDHWILSIIAGTKASQDKRRMVLHFLRDFKRAEARKLKKVQRNRPTLTISA